MNFENFTLWAEADAWPPSQYGLLLKLAIYNNLYNQRIEYPINFTQEKPPTSLDFEEHWSFWGLGYQFELIFDAYWDNLPLLDVMITKFAIPQHYHQRYPASLQRESKSLDLIKDFLYPFGSGPEDALKSDCVYLSKLDCDRQNILNVTTDQLTDFRNKLDQGTRPLPSPYANSFRRWSSYRCELEKQLDTCLQNNTDYIRSFLNKICNCQVESYDSQATNKVELATEIDKITAKSPDKSNIILFAVSGSGKTRSIERLLSHQFGFYFQGCYVPLQTEGFHSAQRTPGSKDTFTLGRIIQYAQEVVRQAGAVRGPNWIRTWLFKPIDLRHFMLAVFLDIASELAITPELLPRLWYSLQVNNEYDIFDEVFQLLCLLDVSLRYSPKMLKPDYKTGNIKFHYCLDEAQGDIDTLIQTFDHTVSLLTAWSETLSDATFFWGRRSLLKGQRTKLGTKIHPQIFSGTSLRTTDAIKAITFEPYRTYSFNSKEYYVFSSFPVIRDDEQFKIAMSKHGLQKLVQSGIKDRKVLLEPIVQHARPLYGRPAWSVWYLKKVENRLQDDSAEDSTEEKIRNASNETGKTNSILEDLCRVVVWSDLTDRPTHFWDDTGPKMIEQAFAVMRKIPGGKISNGITSDETSQYMLAERLALDAAREYLLTVGSDLVKKYLGKYLQEHANTSGGIGKPAEYFLAWMNAVRLSIEEPKIRPNATFYFPEEQAGPDLMFTLHQKSPEGRDEVVLCVLQLKCGEAELEKCIMRTDLSKAYKSKEGVPDNRYQDQHRELENELKAWAAPDPAREFRILRVLVTAAVQREGKKR
ncbi:hypothetical protein MMC29_008123 [Sticta canariensis]|nr:hypothetical protein [Sticta canariensis]